MRELDIQLNIPKEEFKKKLGIVNGKDGKDGLNGRDGLNGKDGYTPIKNVDYFDGQDGKDGSPDSGSEIVKKLSELDFTERLSYNSLKDTPVYIPRSNPDVIWGEIKGELTKQTDLNNRFIEIEEDIDTILADLPNYLYLPGRAGGQTAYGGNVSGTNLNLYSNTSKDGYINFGDSAGYNETLQQLWMGFDPAAGITPYEIDPNVSIYAIRDVNDYHAHNVANINSGNRASADLAIFNDDPDAYLDLGMTSTGNDDPTTTLLGANASYVITNNSNLFLGVRGTTVNNGNIYISSGGLDDPTNIMAAFTYDKKLGFGSGVGQTHPTEMIEFRGSDGSMYTTQYGNWILGEKVTYVNIPAMAINMPLDGYAGTVEKNVILMSGYRSNAGSLVDNINMGLFQRTPTVGNAAFFNFYNALQVDSGTFGCIFRDHTNILGDFFISTGYGTFPSGLPYFRFLASGDGGVTIGKAQDGYGGTIRRTSKGLSVIDHNTDGYITVSGQSNNVGAKQGIEFNYNKGVGAGNFNVARISTYTQSGGGGDLLLETAPQSNLAYTTKVIITKAGLFGIGFDVATPPLSYFDMKGSFGRDTEVISTNTTLGINHYRVLVDDGSTITLPDATTCLNREYNIIRVGTSDVLINTTNSQTISGDLTATLGTNWQSVVVVSDGSNWIRCS